MIEGALDVIGRKSAQKEREQFSLIEKNVKSFGSEVKLEKTSAVRKHFVFQMLPQFLAL